GLEIGSILACGLSERGCVGRYIENIINHLKGQSDRAGVAFQALACRRPGARHNAAEQDTGFEQSTCFHAMHLLKLFRIEVAADTGTINGLAADHAFTSDS